MRKIIFGLLNKFRISLVQFLSIFIIASAHFAQTTEPVIKIHYLGHSSFVLEFDNGITVVTDHGKFNAWVHWGWDSPIYDLGNLIPNIMTYSHTHHEDHYDPDRIPEGVDTLLTENDSLYLNGLKIVPIRVCESNLSIEDNSAFLFKYKGLKILHLGDAQVQIMNISDPEISTHIQSIIPDSLDLLFMTIEGPEQFINEAETFIDLLQPRRMIPMHYWSENYKQNFLNYLENQNDSGKLYKINKLTSEKYYLFEEEKPDSLEIYVPQRGAYSASTDINKKINDQFDFNLNQNYPNPFNPATTISFYLNRNADVKLTIYNMLGEVVNVLINDPMTKGQKKVSWRGNNFNNQPVGSGVYLYTLNTNNNYLTRKMTFLK